MLGHELQQSNVQSGIELLVFTTLVVFKYLPERSNFLLY